MIATGPDQPFSGIIRLTAVGLAWTDSAPPAPSSAILYNGTAIVFNGTTIQFN